MAGVIGVVIGHGEIAVLTHFFGGNDMGSFANATVAFLPGENPVATNTAILFKTLPLREPN